MKFVWAVVLLLVFGGMGVIGGLWLLGSLSPTRQIDRLRFEPAVYSVLAEIQEGEDVRATFLLRSDFDYVVPVSSIHASCGCISVQVDGKSVIGDESLISPRGALPINIVWSTTGKYGFQRQALSVVAFADNRAIEATAEVQAYVNSGPRILPPKILVSSSDGPESLHKLVFYRGRSSADYSVTGVLVSNPDIIVGELSSVSNMQVFPDDDLVAIYKYEFEYRRDLSVSQLDKQHIVFSIVTGANSAVTTIEIPIVCSPVSKSVRFFPERVLISAKAKPESVYITSQGSEITLVTVPKLLNAELVREEGGSFDYRLVVSVADFSIVEVGSLLVVVVRDSNGNVHDLPIRIID